MTAIVAGALAWSWWSLHERHRAGASEPVNVEDLVLVSTAWLCLVGIVATILALCSAFDALGMAIAGTLGGLACWPWGKARPRLEVDVRGLALAAIVLAGGMALRLPLADYPLGGRDQGTYALRARHTLRTGEIALHDPVLAAASEDAGTRSGPGDLLGLYPVRKDAWARDRYEGAYRPGFYLADRKRGVVTPQFLHLHPMLMATGGLVLGPSRVTWVVGLEAALALLAVWAVARRLWPRGPWSWLAAGLVVCSPLAVWVHRTSLTEVLATALTWGAVLAVLRARERPGELAIAGLLLGAGAWLRGNGFIVAPVIAVILWLLPPGARAPRRASTVYIVLVVAAVVAHAGSTYPYLHDELARQLPGDLHPGPGTFTLAALGCALVWWSVDERWGARRTPGRGAAMLARAPMLLVLGLAVVLAAWAVGRGAASDGPPWSRLDPMLAVFGVPWLVTAGFGLLVLARRRLEGSAPEVWLVAIAASILATSALYAQRNLPQLSLYYYGRYVAPEILVALAFAATVAIRAMVEAARARPRLAWMGAVTGALVWASGLVVSVVGVLVTDPVTRLPEFAGAQAVVDHLAARLRPGAVVIAGGEGWHHGHTWNQVGGALALQTGATVLPYRTREAAYATLHELLVQGPTARGTPAPPVYLLLNEASKPYTRDDGMVIAGVDDGLPPPFVAEDIELVELVLDRLTPTRDALPTRVTRDGLRMALLRITVDPARAQTVETYAIAAQDGRPHADGLELRGGRPRGEAACLHPDEPLELQLPPSGAAGEGPVSLVLVATRGTSATVPTWTVTIDGIDVDASLHHAPARARDTLGPFVLPARPRSVSVRGATKAVKKVPCRHGGLAELRLLAADTPALATGAGARAVTFGPPRDLGVPVRAASWVSARGLSRYRAGITPAREIRGLGMVLGAGEALQFAHEWMPDAGRSPVDLVVTLTRSDAGEGARLAVLVDELEVAAFEPPAARDRSWQSPVITLSLDEPVARIGLRLQAGDPTATVEVRDIGLFSRGTLVPGTLAP